MKLCMWMLLIVVTIVVWTGIRMLKSEFPPQIFHHLTLLNHVEFSLILVELNTNTGRKVNLQIRTTLLCYRYVCPKGTFGSHILIWKHGPPFLHIVEISVYINPGSTETTSTTTTTSSVCREGEEFFAHNNKCYKLQTTKLSWSDARKSCQADGGDLASVVDQETNEFIKNLTVGWTWIGGYRVVDDQDVWGWTDGSVWSYENWHTLQPDNDLGAQDVVAMNWGQPGRWDDGLNQTNNQHSYVCQYPIRAGKSFLHIHIYMHS